MTRLEKQPPRFVAVFLMILTLALLVSTYLSLRNSSDSEGGYAPAARTFRIDISSDADTLTERAQKGAPVFKVRQGDAVTLVAASTQQGSLHVHVYDRNVSLVPGGEVALTFEATTAGAFPVHWHDPQGLMIHLAIIEVQPR